MNQENPSFKEQEGNESILDELKLAVWKLSNDANIGYLYKFIEDHGVQQNPYEPENDYEGDLRSIVESDMFVLEKSLNYDRGLERWKLLKDAGALSADLLGKYIGEYISTNMTFTDAERVNSKVTMGKYDKKFLDEFVEELKLQIKNELGWDINVPIDYKNLE